MADGSDKLSTDFKQKAERCGLMNIEKLKQYSIEKDRVTNRKKLKEFTKIKTGHTRLHHHLYSIDEDHYYSSNNIAHVFSSKANFKEIFKIM